MGVRTVRYYTSLPEAFIAKSYLAENGLLSFVFDNNIVSTSQYYCHLIGGVRLCVVEEEFQEAEKLLNEVEQQYLKSEANKCGYCGSFRTVPSVQNKLYYIPAYYFLLTTAVPLLMPPNQYGRLKCRDCGRYTETKDED